MKSMGKRYRSNVAAILQRADGKILIARRSDYPESWQFPQGGVGKGESAQDALSREVAEEVALPAGRYRIAAERRVLGPEARDDQPVAAEALVDGVFAQDHRARILQQPQAIAVRRGRSADRRVVRRDHHEAKEAGPRRRHQSSSSGQILQLSTTPHWLYGPQCMSNPNFIPCHCSNFFCTNVSAGGK